MGGKGVWPEEGGRAIHKRAVHKDNIPQRKKKKQLIGILIDECELDRDEGDRHNSPETSSSLKANEP